jgi:gentisate 1,2-dioxygenase
MISVPKKTPERQAFYDRMSVHSVAPLWEQLAGLLTAEPTTVAEPAIWHYDDVRPFIMEAGEMITAEEAERRVLMLENPAMRGQARITQSLYAGLQLILPGEIAPSHRHMAAALRFIVEGEGAYTTVDGEKTIMRPGDFVITPAWTWHDHGNDSDEPMVWMDGLDIPMVLFLSSMFAESHADGVQPITKPVGDSLARYGAGLLPYGHEAKNLNSPMINYPYDRTRHALEKMRGASEWDPCHGLKMRYVNPESGESAMPTMSTFMQLLPKDFEAQPYQSTDGAIYSVVEGTGTTQVGTETLHWGPRDVFVVPSWSRHSHTASEDAVLFSFSDRVAQEKLGLWRERRGNK